MSQVRAATEGTEKEADEKAAATLGVPLRPSEWQLEFMDRVGAWSDVSGLPPSYLRMMAWLIVCDPPAQSVDDLRDALGLSAGAISMAAGALGRMGIVRRVTIPGQRRVFYRWHGNGWERVLRLRLEATSQIRAAADDALAHTRDPEARLGRMRDMYIWFEASIAEFLAISERGPKVPPREPA